MKIYFLLFGLLAIGLVYGFRRQFLVRIESKPVLFRGATFVQDAFYDCDPEGGKCRPGASDITAYNRNGDRMTIHTASGEDFRVQERFVVSRMGWTRIFPATGEYFGDLSGGNSPRNGTDQYCSDAVPKQFRRRTRKKILGFTAIVYEFPLNWTYDYFPELGCVGVFDSSPAHSFRGTASPATTYVLRQITAGADEALFTPAPGMRDTMPSTALHNAAIARFTASGVNRLLAEERWELTRKEQAARIGQLDAKWNELHKQAIIPELR